MRMWMCNPAFLCRKHLLGEHGEIHKHRHNFVKGHSIEGRRGQIEPASMQARHDELATEMTRRGYNHNSPYEQPDLSGYDLTGHVVDREAALVDLKTRCEHCKARQPLFTEAEVKAEAFRLSKREDYERMLMYIATLERRVERYEQA